MHLFHVLACEFTQLSNLCTTQRSCPHFLQVCIRVRDADESWLGSCDAPGYCHYAKIQQ